MFEWRILRGLILKISIKAVHRRTSLKVFQFLLSNDSVLILSYIILLCWSYIYNYIDCPFIENSEQYENVLDAEYIDTTEIDQVPTENEEEQEESQGKSYHGIFIENFNA